MRESFIVIGLTVIALGLRMAHRPWLRKLGAFVFLGASFALGFFLTGMMCCGMAAILLWFFLPWIELLTRIRRMRLPDGRIVPLLAPVAIDTSKRSASGQGSAGLYLLVTTSTGVYELQVPTTGTVGDTLQVTWMLTNEAYTNHIRRRLSGNDLAEQNGELLRPILFKPRQARYLDNGNILIVNAYNGTTLVRSGNNIETREFPGEVFELNARNYRENQNDLGFSNSSIVWSTLDRPELSGSYQLRKPSSADRGGF